MNVARVRCSIRLCGRIETIIFEPALGSEETHVDAFNRAAAAARWTIQTERLASGEIVARDRCPEHPLAPPVAGTLGRCA